MGLRVVARAAPAWGHGCLGDAVDPAQARDPAALARLGPSLPRPSVAHLSVQMGGTWPRSTSATGMTFQVMDRMLGASQRKGVSQWQQDQRGLCLPPWAPKVPSTGLAWPWAPGSRALLASGGRGCQGPQERRRRIPPACCWTNTPELSGGRLQTVGIRTISVGTAYLCSVVAGAPASNTWRQVHPLWCQGWAESRRVSYEHGGPLCHSWLAPCQLEWRQPHCPCWGPWPPWQSRRGADEVFCGLQLCSLLLSELATKHGPRPEASSPFCGKGSVPSKQDALRARASVCSWEASVR